MCGVGCIRMYCVRDGVCVCVEVTYLGTKRLVKTHSARMFESPSLKAKVRSISDCFLVSKRIGLKDHLADVTAY